MFQALLKAPSYHLGLEAVLLVSVLWLLLRKSYHPQDQQQLTEKEKEELIEEWKPEPLVPDPPKDHPAFHPRVITSKAGKWIEINGRKCLNTGTHNYLGLVGRPDIEEVALKCMDTYGVGACGPRGFFGTTAVHLELEKRMAAFMKVEAAVLYSYGFACVASAIPAYAKRGDVIFVDERVNFSIQKGVQASRSDVHFFKHNDMDHFKQLLDEQAVKDKKNPKKAAVTKRFVIVEGMYMNSGEILPLPKLIQLKNEYKVRLLIDETLSFGVLGKTGRGVFELYNIDVEEADWVCIGLDHAMGSVGGMCLGSNYVVDHQTLSGLGYCFSASLPPLLAAAVLAALDLLEKDTALVDSLSAVCERLHQRLLALPHLTLTCHTSSPIKHLLPRVPAGDRDMDLRMLRDVVAKCETEGLAVTVAEYLCGEEKHLPPASIKLCVQATLSPADLDLIIATLTSAANHVYGELS